MKTRGFTCGTYDLFHTGHVLALKEARSKCGILHVGLQTDPTIDRRTTKNKPILSIGERLVLLQACRYVDDIWIYNTEHQLYEYLDFNQKRIDIRFLGEDWKDKPYTGYKLPIPVIFTSRTHSYSSTELRKRIIES